MGTGITVLRDGERYDEIETWPLDRMGAWQLERIREVVGWAFDHSPLYRRLWQSAGLNGEDLAGLRDLSALPIVGKNDLVEAGQGWSAETGRVGFSTRGTSGEPLVVWLLDAESESFVRPTMRGFWWAGFRPGTTALLLSPAWHRLAAMEGHAAVRLGGQAVYFWGTFGPRHIADFLRVVDRERPQFVSTTPPFLLSVLRHLQDEGADPRAAFAGVRSIVTVGLPLTPQLRAWLVDRLGVGDIFERGGTQEGAATDECAEHGAPHIHADVCHLEVVDARGAPVPPGERGELVVTKLTVGGGPVVRYRTEDIAALFTDPCACGRTLPRLKIYGRPESSVSIGGRWITAYDVRSCVDASPALVGRLILLVRDPKTPRVLTVAIEGHPDGAAALEEHLARSLGVEEVALAWLGESRMAWGFRQVVDASEVAVGRGKP